MFSKSFLFTSRCISLCYNFAVKLEGHPCIVVIVHESENWQRSHRLMSRHFPSCLNHVLFKNMENPLIAERIQLERFISVEVFEKIGNTFEVLVVFLILLRSQKIFVLFGDNLYQYYSISEKTATPKMAKLQNSPYFCVFKYARAVKQKVWNEAENRAYDSHATLHRFLC